MELLLEKNELVNMGKRVKGCTILCTHGRCWITREKDLNDYVLMPGKEIEVAGNGLLVVTAIDNCRIKVVLPGHKRGFVWGRRLTPQRSM